MAKRSTGTTERVSVTLPRAREGEDKTFFVSVNGVNYLIPKGRTSDVPDFVAEEIARAQEAEERMYNAKESLLNAGK